MHSAAEQAARDLATANGRQANLENRRNSIQKLTSEQIVGEVQTLRTATEKAARDLASASDGQASLESRLRAMKEDAMKEQIAGEPQAMQPATEQAASSANDRQTSLESHLKSVEKLTKEQTTTTGQAASSANHRVLTKEQIDSELQALETVTAAAARDCVSLTISAIHTKSDEKLTKEQMAHQLLELAMDVQHAKDTVCGRASELLLKLCFTERASRDAGELQYVKTATEKALEIVNAFMAGFEQDEP